MNRLSKACRRAGILWSTPGGGCGPNLGVMGELVPPFIVGLYTAGAPTAELHPGLVVIRVT